MGFSVDEDEEDWDEKAGMEEYIIVASQSSNVSILAARDRRQNRSPVERGRRV